jgi:hypothetical protein
MLRPILTVHSAQHAFVRGKSHTMLNIVCSVHNPSVSAEIISYLLEILRKKEQHV